MGLFDPWTDSIRKSGVLLSDAVAQFIRSREGRSAKTIHGYTSILRIFGESLPAGYLVQHVSDDSIARFLRKQNINNTSRETYVRHLNVFFNWAVEEKLVESNPVAALKQRRRGARKTTHQIRFLTESEFSILTECIRLHNEGKEGQELGSVGDLWLIDVVTFAANTGLRRGEICSLRWGAVTLSERMLTVRNTEDFKTKSGAERSIFLAGTAWRVIERLSNQSGLKSDDYVFRRPDGQPLSGDYLTKKFLRYRRKAGLSEDIGFHELRHTFASWAVMRGMDLYRLKEIMGHSDIKMTLRYAHLRPDATRQDMERFFGDDRQETTQADARRLREENNRLREELLSLKDGRMAA